MQKHSHPDCSRSIHWRHAILLFITLLTHPNPLFAQSHTLRVTIHDVGGRGLSHISIVVRDEAGRELDRALSDAAGTAEFRDLPEVVRVAVQGQPQGGPRLYQLGDDARGVRLALASGESAASLALRAERDGLVLPDPAIMLSLEEGGPVVAEPVSIATAVLATPAPLPTAVTTAHSPSHPNDAASARSAQRAAWAPWVTVLVLAAGICVLRLIQRRRTTS